MLNRVTLLSACVIVAVVVGARGWSSAPPEIPKSGLNPGELVCRLDRESAHPGEVVKISGFVRADHNDAVREVSHRIVRVAEYDVKAGRMKNLKPTLFRTEPPIDDQVFDGLPLNLASTGALRYDTKTPREKGITFKFRPKFLGTYMIYTTWLFNGSKERVESQPVVLVVKPPLDAEGKPIVKPEWLPEDDE